MDTTTILRNARTICVYGLSRTKGKPAHDIPLYLRDQGYTVYGVTPFTGDIEGISCYATLDDVPGPIDIVDVFRPSDVTDAIVDEALARHAKHGDIGCLWLQLGITSEHGREKCEAAGVAYVENTCIYVAHRKMEMNDR